MGDYTLLLTNPLNYGVCRVFHLRQQRLLRGRNCFESSSFIVFSSSFGVHQLSLPRPCFFFMLSLTSNLLPNIASALVGSLSDCAKLQKDVYSSSEGCSCSHLLLNKSKVIVTTYSRERSFISFSAEFIRIYFSYAFDIRDLGVLFDRELHLYVHVQKVTNFALCTLGFIPFYAVPNFSMPLLFRTE